MCLIIDGEDDSQSIQVPQGLISWLDVEVSLVERRVLEVAWAPGCRSQLAHQRPVSPREASIWCPRGPQDSQGFETDSWMPCGNPRDGEGELGVGMGNETGSSRLCEHT